MRPTFGPGAGQKARELCVRLIQARSGCPAAGVLPPDSAGPYEETTAAPTPLRRLGTGSLGCWAWIEQI